MSASITDKFNKAADGNGSYPTLATVSATRSASEATLTCQDLTGWATDTPVHFSTYQLNSSGVVDTTTQTDWKGIVSGNTITNLTRIAGAADTGNAIGDIVELNPTIGWLDDLVTGLLATHKQDGSLKDNIVKSNNIDSATITNDKIAADTITGAKVNWDSGPTGAYHSTFSGTMGTSQSTLKSFTLQPGRYVIIVAATIDSDVEHGTGFSIDLRKSSESGTAVTTLGMWISGGPAITQSNVTFQNIGSATTFYLTCKCDSSTAGIANGNIMAFRIL